MGDGFLSLRNVSKGFNGNVILNALSLDVKEGEFVTLLGPSGCGKTTTLRLIGGFETPDSGDIFFEGKRINDVAPNLRNINTVFQKYALFPHLNVFDNIAFGLKLRGVSRAEQKKRVEEMLELIDLKGFNNRSIDSLSGGQQQRVAIARAIVVHPKVLLLDEPLGALDLKLRKEMQIELKKLHDSLGITFIYVTHDQEEALTMSDKVVVMNKGEILQQGTPIDIYNEPQNAFVADFIGESNIFSGIMKRDKYVEFFGTAYDCVDVGFAPDEPVDIVWRPEDLVLLKEGAPSLQKAESLLHGRVISCLFKGIYYEIMLEVEGAGNYQFMAKSTIPTEPGSEVLIDIDPENIQIMKKSNIETLTMQKHRFLHDPNKSREDAPDEDE
ncbi:MAG: ABC transporter ATP-binding protein [Anaerovoracaceae bacterium]|nr:ABC transporter ATP-binding protein [Bacillota bacterium]MDY2670700.1 ABC transporter ATP-binding protein [Anaerovoracaceae bacterium]